MYTQEYSYDDILLVPTRPSIVPSRSKIDLRTEVMGRSLSIPVIAAPMTSISSRAFFQELSDRGGIGIVHRFQSIDEQLAMAGDPKLVNSILAMPLDKDLFATKTESRIRAAYAEGHRSFLIDIANGFSVALKKTLAKLKKEYPDCHWMVGNVADWSGFQYCADMKVDSIRVGIGTGHACTTRHMAGVGRPILSAIMSITERHNPSTNLVADGGVRKPADIVKALAFGSNSVMVGSLFARTYESGGWTDEFRTVEMSPRYITSPARMKTGVRYKNYQGSASYNVQSSSGKSPNYIEGESYRITADYSLEKLLEAIKGGIQSAIAYLGYDNLSEFREHPRDFRWVVVPPNNKEGFEGEWKP